MLVLGARDRRGAPKQSRACLAACERISGPVSWANQQLRVGWDNDRERDEEWVFTLQDDSVNFKAVGGLFCWRRDYDLVEFHSIYFPSEPADDTADR